MRITSDAGDGAILEEIGERIARTRLDRNWTQEHLAGRASVGVTTLRRLEGGGGATLTNLVRVLRALDLLDALEAALPAPAPSPIAQLRTAGRVRRRASGRRDASSGGDAAGARGRGDGDEAPWRWGDEDPA